jgi:enamine deaminase RidA (YjgF/YER057c/UK114 family)
MSAGVAADSLVFFSGVIGADESGRPVRLSETMKAELHRAGSAGKTNDSVYSVQAAAAISALTRRVEAAGATLANIVHLSVYIDDIMQFSRIEPALQQAFGDHRPALTVLEVPAPAPVRGACVSLTAIGWLGEVLAASA